jgi:hypothetical protein
MAFDEARTAALGDCGCNRIGRLAQRGAWRVGLDRLRAECQPNEGNGSRSIRRVEQACGQITPSARSPSISAAESPSQPP